MHAVDQPDFCRLTIQVCLLVVYDQGGVAGLLAKPDNRVHRKAVFWRAALLTKNSHAHQLPRQNRLVAMLPNRRTGHAVDPFLVALLHCGRDRPRRALAR